MSIWVPIFYVTVDLECRHDASAVLVADSEEDRCRSCINMTCWKEPNSYSPGQDAVL